MRMPAVFAALPVLAAFEMGAAPPAHAATADIADCSLTAISSDRDPNGLNIRAGPSADSEVIGRIPPPREIGGEEFAGEVSITGSRDGWFRIDDAWMPDYIWDDYKDVFDGVGWVSGRHLYAWLEALELRSGPSLSASIVADFTKPNPTGKPDETVDLRIRGFHACLGNWVEVDVIWSGAVLRGWTYGTCPSQVTTCGGGHIPNPE